MSDIAKFYKLITVVQVDEQLRKEAGNRLKENYDELVQLCPHSEAVDRKSNLRGMGTTRRCTICGITDYASEGGTPGDEYNYGYPGYPSRTFWAGSEIRTVSDKEFDKYSRHHDWVVTDGKPRKRFS
jgi:hypothetical protein